jgi:hypothetical protein
VQSTPPVTLKVDFSGFVSERLLLAYSVEKAVAAASIVVAILAVRVS